MANFTAEQYDILQEILKVITEARQTSERLSESWAKGLANPIGPHTTHLSSPITPTTPSQSPQPPDPPDLLLVDPEPLVETMKNSGPFIESLKSASVLQVPNSFCDVLLVHRVHSHVKEVEESPQQPTNSDDQNVAHQVFAQMPLGVTSKEKQRKSLKAWKFKFKTSFKRSQSMDVKFFSVEEIAWFTRDSKEINWGCVNKEFKEAVAGCGKKIINRFKMVDETSKPAAYDGTFQIRVWDCGGSLLEYVWWRRLKHCQRYCHEMQAIEAENKSPETLGDHPFAPMKPCQSYAQPCLKCGAEMTILLAKETQNWMVTAWFKIQVFSDFDIASWIGLENYFGCETKRHMLLRVKLANRVWESGELLATHAYCKWLENCYVRDRVLKYYFLLEMPFAEFIEIKACRKELSVAGLSQLSLASDGKSNEEAVTVLAARPQLFNTFLRICEYNKVDNPWVCNDRQKGAVCDAENKKLLNIKAGAKKGTNNCLGGKIAVALAREKGMVSKVGGSTFDLECDQIKFNNKEEFVGLTESSELRPSKEYLLMNFGIFMNPQPLHDKRITRALLVGLVGTEEKLSNRLSLANYVWKPGELLCVQDQWDWISEVHSGGGVLKITQQLRGMRLQGLINMDKKLQKLLVDDVLRVMVCWNVHNRICEAERKIYISANQNSRNQELPITYRFLMIGKFSWSKRLNETCCFLLEKYFDEFVGCNAHGNETQNTNQSHGMEGSKSDIQDLESGHNRIVLKLKLPLSFGADLEQLIKWVDVHFSDNQRQEKGLLIFPLELMLANLKENHVCGVDTRCLEPDGSESICCISRTCEADHISYRTFPVGGVHEFFTCSKLQNGDETHGKRLLVLNEIPLLNNDYKGDFTIEENWSYTKPMIREVFHLQRPPELIGLQENPNFITKVTVQWKEHPPDQFFSSFYGQVLMLSSLRTRMFSTGEYCNRKYHLSQHYFSG